MPAGAGKVIFGDLIFPENPVSRQVGNVISGDGEALLGLHMGLAPRAFVNAAPDCWCHANLERDALK